MPDARLASTPGAAIDQPTANLLPQDSDDEDERTIRKAISSIRERGEKYKRLFLRAQKEASGLGSERDKCWQELQEAKTRIQILGAEKEIMEHRWKVSKGQYKKVLASSKEVRSDLKAANNRIRYLEKLLAFEERSGYSTLVSEMQLV